MVRYFLKSRPTISPLGAAQPFLLFCHQFERAIDPIGEIGNSSSRNLETATEWILPHSFNRSVRRWTPSTYECIICRSRSVTKRPQSFNSHSIPTKFLKLRNYLKTLKFNTFLKHWVTFKTYRAKVSLADYSRCTEVQLRDVIRETRSIMAIIRKFAAITAKHARERPHRSHAALIVVNPQHKLARIILWHNITSRILNKLK